MNKLFTCALLSLSSSLLFAQTPNLSWVAKTSGAQDLEQGISTAADAAGNVYLTGQFSATVDFDPGPGVYNLTAPDDGMSYPTNIFISKYDAAGNFLWAKSIGSAGYDQGLSVTVDPWGNVLVCGEFTGTADFNPDPAVTMNITAGGPNNGFILKLNSLGDFVWAKTFEGTGNNSAISLCTDASGSTYVTGLFDGTNDFDPGTGTQNITSVGTSMFLVKLDSAGNKVWANAVKGVSLVIGRSIHSDPFGSFVVTGWFNGNTDFNPGAGTFNLSPSSAAPFVAKYDTSGVFTWAKMFGDGYGFGVTTDAYGNVYSTGMFEGTSIDFDPGAGTYLLSNSGFFGTDIFISKLSVNGSFVWAKSIGSFAADESLSIAVDDSCNVYTVGTFQATADFDPGAGTFNLTPPGFGDAFALRLDSAGNFAWAEQISSDFEVKARGVHVDAAGSVYVAGSFVDTADFDPGPGTYSLGSAGSLDAFVQKLSPLGTMPVSLISFSGNAIFKANKLMWGTSSEINNRGFIVEKSNDGISFLPIEEIRGKGNSSAIVNYSYVDLNPGTLNYYRLKQVDFDGRYTYSTIVMIKQANDITTEPGFSVSPNPASEKITVYYNGTVKQIAVTLFDLAGKPLMKQTGSAPAFTFDVSTLAPGVYVTELNDGQKTSRVKFVKN